MKEESIVADNQPVNDLVVEIGPGNHGHALLDLSPTIRKQIERGRPFISISNARKNLRRQRIGAVAHKDIDSFVNDPFLEESIGLLYVGNVFSVLPFTMHPDTTVTEGRIRGLVRKLIPKTGTAVIVENYTPVAAENLTKIDYGALGCTAEVILGADAYRAKLKSMGINESKTARWFASQHSQSGILWEPFLIILIRK